MATAAGSPIVSLRKVDLRGEGRWLAVLAAVILIEVAWWALCWRAGIVPVPQVAAYVALAVACLLGALALRLLFRPRAERASWTVLLIATMLVGFGASLFLPLKYAIPRQVPFWLDVPLAVGERQLFGTDPWRIADHAFGWALVPVDRLYALWLPVQSLVLFSVLLLPPSASKSRALIAYSLAWFLLGVVGAVLCSSVGPVFYDRLLGGHQFAALHERLATGAWMVRGEADAMWASFASGRPGLVAGISAMPSLHVAISFWIWLTARGLAPRAAPAALAYAVFVWIASVQLGWHYISDGLAGLLGMLAVWWLAHRIAADDKTVPTDEC
jgi:PAP2 superfamily